MREIKFKTWNKKFKTMSIPFTIDWLANEKSFNRKVGNLTWLEFTGLLDKNKLKEIYEGDIIDTEGNLIANVYETHKGETDFVIQGFGTKDWCATYKKAMERGCKDA